MIHSISKIVNVSKSIALAFAILLLLSACSSANTPATQPTQALPASAPSPSVAPTQPAPPAQAEPEPMKPIRVVTTTNFVADWVKNIGGDRVDVFSLLPPGSDPHSYQPGAKDVAQVAEADLVLTVGLGLESSWIQELLNNAAKDPSTVVELADAIDPIEFSEIHQEDGHDHDEHGHDEESEDEHDHDDHDHDKESEDEHGHDEHDHDEESEDEHDHDEHDHDEESEDEHDHDEHDHDEESEDEHGHDEDEDEHGHDHDEDEHGHDEDEDEHGHDGHDHGQFDPHFWFDPIRVKRAVTDISSRLAVLDPDGADAYRSSAASYNAKLDELHAWTQAQVDQVPQDHRLLVTSHDSMGYFANLYGFEVVGVILSTTTEVEPSPADLAELSHKIEDLGVSAVFGETTVSERLAISLASESGVEVVRLYSGSLGDEGSGAETYIDMVRTNVESIVSALK